MGVNVRTNYNPGTTGASDGPFTPQGRHVDRASNGVLWTMHNYGRNVDMVQFWYSTDNGATWINPGGASHLDDANAGQFQNWPIRATFFIDLDDYVHCFFAYGGSGAPNVWYARGALNSTKTAITWEATQTQVATGISLNYAKDCVVHREGTGWVAHVVYVGNSSGANPGVYYARVAISSGGTRTVTGATRVMALSGGNNQEYDYQYPSIDFAHTGDGKTVAGGAPHLGIIYVAALSSTSAGHSVAFKRMAYSAGTWTGGTQRDIATTHRSDQNTGSLTGTSGLWASVRWDGTRWVIGGMLLNKSTSNLDLMVWERDAADTTTTTRTLAASLSTANRLLHGQMGVDLQGNVYLIGMNNDEADGSRDMVYRKWTRATATLEAEVVLDTAITGNHHAKISSHQRNSRVDMVWAKTIPSGANGTIVHDAVVLNQAPTAPTLTNPADGATVDLSGTPAFTATFNDPDPADLISGYRFRRKISGAGAYEYWNATLSAWQSTEVTNPASGITAGNPWTYTFPTGAWTNGSTWQWSVGFDDAQGATGPYATDATVTAVAPATLTVTGPTGSVTDTSRPATTWSRSHPDGIPQTKYHVKVFDQATYTAGGFDPATATPTADSGVRSSETARSWTPTVDLTNGTTYRSYVRIAQTGDVWTGWGYTGYTLALTPPDDAVVIDTPLPDQARVQLDITGQHDPLDFPVVTYRLQRSDDGGATWKPVRHAQAVQPDGNFEATAWDYEAPPGVECSWRVIVDAEV